MKKKLFFLSLIGLMSVTYAYAKCDGGSEVTNSVGTTFCKSNEKLNWWSAAVWCKANGLHLATMYEMCPSWDGNTGSGKCPELQGTGNVYARSATAHVSDRLFGVHLSDGSVHNTGFRNEDSYDYAFCR